PTDFDFRAGLEAGAFDFDRGPTGRRAFNGGDPGDFRGGDVGEGRAAAAGAFAVDDDNFDFPGSVRGGLRPDFGFPFDFDFGRFRTDFDFRAFREPGPRDHDFRATSRRPSRRFDFRHRRRRHIGVFNRRALRHTTHRHFNRDFASRMRSSFRRDFR